jgi:hypothetical protein
MSKELQLLEPKLFNYSYGRYLPNGILALGVLLLFLAAKFIVDGFTVNLLYLIPSPLLILIGIAIFTPIELFQIDFDKKQYRIAIKWFSRIYGEWKPIGEVKYLSIINISKHISLSDNNIDAKVKEDLVAECQLRLFVKAGKHLIVDDYHQKSSAIIIAELIAKGLQLNVLDATIKPPEFIGEVY